MVRPKVPLISRHNALIVALRIIDEEGLDALSIRRLATELGVNGASLYHHFRSKEEILTGVVELALAEVRGAGESPEGWRQWLPENARRFREALLAHPALLPLVAQRFDGVGTCLLDASAARLMSEGMPVGAVMPLLDALAAFAISSAMHETRGGAARDRLAADEHPSLATAVAERGMSAEQIYDLVIASILQAIETVVEQQRARWLPAVPS